MRVHGRCHCGAIEFEADIDPELAVICNCSDCQIFSGAPFRAIVPAPAASFQMRGEPRIYVKRADSGRLRAQAFCGQCGTSIYSAGPDAPSRYNVRLGLLRERHEIPARQQIWRESALAWAQDVSRLPLLPQTGFVEPNREEGTDEC